MREIAYERVVAAVSDLCVSVCYELGAEMIEALERCRASESNAGAADLLGQLLDNAQLAASERIPLCQDTGVAVVFVEQGNRCCVLPPSGRPGATLDDAINEGVRNGYDSGFLRKSIVAEGVHSRVNTDTNTPAVVHHRRVSGEGLKLTVMAKGGGCENRSVLAMLKPTAGAEVVKQFIIDAAANAGADACPPFIIGVGIGGTFEKCCELAKYALIRPLNSLHDDPFYAAMEQDILKRVNALGIGPAGLGGNTTAIAVLIETYPCHIASLPVAVNIECHSHRHGSVVI